MRFFFFFIFFFGYPPRAVKGSRGPFFLSLFLSSAESLCLATGHIVLWGGGDSHEGVCLGSSFVIQIFLFLGFLGVLFAFFFYSLVSYFPADGACWCISSYPFFFFLCFVPILFFLFSFCSRLSTSGAILGGDIYYTLSFLFCLFSFFFPLSVAAVNLYFLSTR